MICRRRKKLPSLKEHRNLLDDLPDLKLFVLEKIRYLDNGLLICLGNFSGFKGKAILTLSKTSFPGDLKDLQTMFNQNEGMRKVTVNNSFGQFECHFEQKGGSSKLQITYPAKPHEIKRFDNTKKHKSAIIRESGKDFDSCHAPLLPKLCELSSLAWVYAMLDKTQEAEKLIFEDPDPIIGFVLHPDPKWDEVKADDLSSLAIVQLRDSKENGTTAVRCLRDLRGKHLPMLLNLRTKVIAALKAKWCE